MPLREEGTPTGEVHPDFGEVRIREGQRSVVCPVCHGTTTQPNVCLGVINGVDMWLGCYHCMGRGYSFLMDKADLPAEASAR